MYVATCVHVRTCSKCRIAVGDRAAKARFCNKNRARKKKSRAQ